MFQATIVGLTVLHLRLLVPILVSLCFPVTSIELDGGGGGENINFFLFAQLTANVRATNIPPGTFAKPTLKGC